MASKFTFALFISSISLIVLNVNAAREHGDLLEDSEVLNRLKKFTGLLYSKFVGANVDNLSTPEAIIERSEFPAADYQFIRMMALHAKYQFNDDKLPFDQWLKRIQKKDTSKVNEDPNSLHQRKQNNARTAYDFVAIMCALVRDTLIYDQKFDDYMPIFERMEEAKKAIEKNAEELAKVGKVNWQDFNVEKMSLNRLSGESIWGLLAMKENVLTEEFMNSKPHLTADNIEQSSDDIFNRKHRISVFLEHYLKQKLMKRDPVDFLRSAAGRMGNDPVLSTINLHLARTLGYTDWQDEFIAGGRSSPHLVFEGMGKVLQMLTALYLMVWEAPFNMQMQSMKDYYPVYEQLRQVEEHYMYKGRDPIGWANKVEKAKLMLKNEFILQVEQEEHSEGMVTAYGRGGSNWSWVWASDNFIENSLARTKKGMPSSSSP